ncbi:PREDICTED: pancreatic lipase-related protein 2-like [Nicrophorus vespilloides]|uniref:Pancreatic lipase-related protein 2-like n=1 Tax=Nicrophorus vespilloides TaxID=110193 RepID=A0ABM1NFM5_NICVS|nr:PREDICTED: pancreatic lipase-related protein 2-like [Nicrophorus vespilloides]
MDAGNLLLACLLSALPGPPGVSIEDAYVQLFPIPKLKCPTIDPVRDISYQLYTSENPLQPDLLIHGDDISLKNSHFDFQKPTVIFFHAFFETYTSAPANTIKTAYLQRKDHNVILLDAQRMEAGPWYLTAARNTRVVGEYTAAFIDYLVSRGLYLPSLHLIGLSLGAQMAGVCGQNVKSGRIQRITGLDPAGPLFTKWPRSLKLDKGDAEFVDVIHTDAGIFGYPWPVGHADFWPNSGKAPQPGCTIPEVKRRSPDSIIEPLFCSHWRSYMFYSESVITANAFQSYRCNSWKEFLRGECDPNQEPVNMGFTLSPKARGKYYLTTRRSSPFTLSNEATLKADIPQQTNQLEGDIQQFNYYVK